MTIGNVNKNDQRRGLASDNARAPTDIFASGDKVRIVRQRGSQQQYQSVLQVEIGW
jgi:hypothetical protein